MHTLSISTVHSFPKPQNLIPSKICITSGVSGVGVYKILNFTNLLATACTLHSQMSTWHPNLQTLTYLCYLVLPYLSPQTRFLKSFSLLATACTLHSQMSTRGHPISQNSTPNPHKMSAKDVLPPVFLVLVFIKF